MKHLKTYENLQKQPQIGDYAIVDLKRIKDELEDFTDNNICQIKEIKERTLYWHYDYQIEFDTVPEKYHYLFQRYLNDKNYSPQSSANHKNVKYRRWISENNILFFSDNIEDCQLYIQAKKYNM